MWVRRLGTGLFTALLALAVAACNSNTEKTGSGGQAIQRPVEAVEGCDSAWTDPADLSPDRKPARCAPGFPQPQPLPEKVKLVVTSATVKGEFVAPLRFAIARGEFEKENLEVELTQVPPADAYNLLASGKSDVAAGAPEAAFMNAVHAGVEAKWVLGNFFPHETSKTGLWARDVDGRAAKVTDLKGQKIATAIGAGSVSMYPVVTAFNKEGIRFDEVEFQVIPVADLTTAFENGAVPAAYLTDPYWTLFNGKPGYTFLAGQPRGEPLGGVIFGRNILYEKREAGLAFVRALIRTISTYFPLDYKNDPQFVQEVADTVEIPVDVIKQTPPLQFDWEIRAGTTDRLQEAYRTTGALKESISIPENKLVDRSFYEAVVGRK